MTAVSPVLSSFTKEPIVKWSITVSIAVSPYAFCLALPLAASGGRCELSSEGPASDKQVCVSNVVGAVALVHACLISL
jgi:hypothetical protein